jgi:hypothetical protein
MEITRFERVTYRDAQGRSELAERAPLTHRGCVRERKIACLSGAYAPRVRKGTSTWPWF